jgi:hypothetical protein
VRRLRLPPALALLSALVASACSLLTGVSDLQEIPCDAAACTTARDVAPPPGDARDAGKMHAVDADAAPLKDTAVEPIVCEAGLVACTTSCVAVESNPDNCGTCGHSCLGGACKAGVCQPVTLGYLPDPLAIAVSDTGVYFTTSSGIVASLPIDGGTPATLWKGGLFLRHIVATKGALYWCDDESGIVTTSALDGSGAAKVASNQPDAWDLTVDSPSLY